MKMSLKSEKNVNFNKNCIKKLEKYILFYKEIGCVIVPVDSKKVPIVQKIKNVDGTFMQQFSVKELLELRCSYNIYFTCNKYFVIDVDVKDKDKDGLESFERFCEDFDIPEFRNYITTPSGGFHFLCKKPENFKFSKDYKQYPGIEFLQNFCMMAGSYVEKDGYSGYYKVHNQEDYMSDDESIVINEFSADIWTKLESLSCKEEIRVSNNNELNNFNVSLLDEILSNFDSDCYRSEWFSIIASVHSWSKASDEAKASLMTWSKTSKKYKSSEFNSVWRSLQLGRDNKITVGTLFYMLRERNYGLYRRVLDSYKKEIPTAKKESTYDVEFDKWIYLIATSKDKSFYNVENNIYCGGAKFDEICTKFTPMTEKGVHHSALMLFKQGHLLKRVLNTIFYPFANFGICQKDGQEYYNTFNKEKLLKPAIEVTEEGEKIRFLFVKALQRICDKDYRILGDWFAWQVQHPGKLLGWCPLIQGEEGSGKSVLGRILVELLHPDYVSIITTDNISSNFNGWSENKLNCIIEEIKISGESRYTIINKLKPFITNDFVSTEKKFAEVKETPNFCNFIAFTNFRDSVPLGEESRRFCVFFDNTNPSEFKNQDFFEKNYKPIFENIAQLKLSLMKHNISEGFGALRRAPETRDKQFMSYIEKDKVEYSFEFEEFISENKHTYNQFFLVGHDIWDKIVNPAFEKDKLTKLQKSALLRIYNYSSAGTISYNGAKMRVYVKNTKLTAKKISKLLQSGEPITQELIDKYIVEKDEKCIGEKNEI